MGQLLSDTQYRNNKRRTIKKGLITLLDEEQLETLSLQYYGIKDEKGNYIGYECPYSGEIIYDSSNLVLEHIIPVNSGGGTALFNCIPTSEKVNNSGEKGTKNLLDWWLSSGYFTVERLEKLVNYILDGYEVTFENKRLDLINEYNVLLNDTELAEEDNIEEYQDKILNPKRTNKKEEIVTYYGFLLDCVKVLKDNNVDTLVVEQRINNLKNDNVFSNIDNNYENFYSMFSRVLKEILKEEQIDEHSIYSYSMNCNVLIIMDSINKESINNQEEILKERLNNIKKIVESNGHKLKDYFESLSDLEDNILYKRISDITKQDIDNLYENISLTVETKIDIFIKMLNKGNKDILSPRNTQYFEGTDKPIGYFWSSNKVKIKQKLFEELKDDPTYDIARQIIEEYERDNNIDYWINLFIKMLNKGNKAILKVENNQLFEGIDKPIGIFWQINKVKIKQKLFEELKDNLEYGTARQVIEEFERDNNTDYWINLFIKMLNQGNKEILRQGNKQYFEGTNKKIRKFWSRHKAKIKQILIEDLKDDPTYNIARQVIEEYERDNNTDYWINLFIKMLNKGNKDILKDRNNQQTFVGTDKPIGHFWQNYKAKIRQKLFEDLKDVPTYDIARQVIEEFERDNNTDYWINLFIKMLNKGNKDILKDGNNQLFEGTEKPISHFWQNYKAQIKQKLFEDLKDNPEYDIARQVIEEYERDNNIDYWINLFIKMLNQGNKDILSSNNQQTFVGTDKPIGQFWQNKKAKIKQKLFEGLKDDPTYDTARQVVLDYCKVSSYEELLKKEELKKELKKAKETKKQLESMEARLDNQEEIRKAV